MAPEFGYGHIALTQSQVTTHKQSHNSRQAFGHTHSFSLSLTHKKMHHCAIILPPVCALTLWPSASSFAYCTNEVLALRTRREAHTGSHTDKGDGTEIDS